MSKFVAIIVSYDTVATGGDGLMGLDAIRKILSDMRTAIDNNKFQPVKRDKNLNTLALLGISWQDAKNAIYNLTEKEYRRGPMLDQKDPSSDYFWEFKTRVGSEVIYVKFKVLYQKDGRVKLVSFHIDE